MKTWAAGAFGEQVADWDGGGGYLDLVQGDQVVNAREGCKKKMGDVVVGEIAV